MTVIGRSGRFGSAALLWAAVTASVAFALAACGPGGVSVGAGGSGTADGRSGATDGVGRAAPPSGESPADVLAKWQAFPVTADPRPLILTNGEVLDPATGFLTGEDKLSYLAGNLQLATTVPVAPAIFAGYAIVSVKAALGRLRETASNQPGTRPLRIVKVSLVQATFGTDRGTRALPAWRFDLDHVRDPVQVLAVVSKQLWRPGFVGSTGVGYGASLSGDGQSLDYSFSGSPAGPSPCGAEYTADVTASRTTVVVTPREIKPNPQGTSSQQACTTMAARRTVTVRLAAPLGARVLLTPDGSPIPVTSR